MVAAMLYVLRKAFGTLVKTGNLNVIEPSGKNRIYGDGSGPSVTLRIHDNRTVARLAVDPDLYLGEAYMDGGISVGPGSIYDLLALFTSNAAKVEKLPAGIAIPYALRRLFRKVKQYNPVGRAERNVAHHYDLSGELYDLFLDRDRQYSCAYFETPNATLAEAQKAKKRHLAAKLDIQPGMKVLDIGSGWGGLGLYLAEVCGAEVTGVTLSHEQHRLSNARAQQRGVSDRVRFELLDYRLLEDRFDRIVSVGMFEHVGVGHYREFFDKVKTLLTPEGIACLHSIGRANGPGSTSAWISKYIFPGGYIPALSEVVPHIEKSGLYVTDIEILRLHYAETLKEWRRRFADHRDRAEEIYDERFYRMWEFYLAGSECAFRYEFLNNFQVQFTRDKLAVPLTRNYIHEEEERLRHIDTKRRQLAPVPRPKDARAS
jgi:cyclopropane-fatty-acyl-phospholipid synthase